MPVIVGVGAVESSSYANGAEQPEVLPARSVALARSSVTAFSGTVTVIPAPRPAPEPTASGVPTQNPA